jgi:hypothetical protein
MRTIDQMLNDAIEHAKMVLVDQENAELTPTWLVQEKEMTNIIGTPWGNEFEKSMVISLMRAMVKARAHSYSFMSEAWMATEDPNHPTGLAPCQREDKREVVIISAFDRQGGTMRTYEIKRDAKGVVSDLVLENPPFGCFGGRLHNLFRDSHED